MCPSSPGQPAWSRAGTSSPGQSKGRTGLLAFPERAHWWTFYRESFNVPLILFPFLVLNSLHRKRHGYLVLWIREWSRSCWMKKTQPFLSDEVCGGYCALSSSYSRSQSPALHTLRRPSLESLLKFAPAVPWLCWSHLARSCLLPWITTVLTGETPLFFFESPQWLLQRFLSA